MARTAKNKELNSAPDGFDDDRLEQAGRAAQELAVFNAQLDATVRAVALQIGYQLPADCTDPDLIQRDISANMRRSVEACLEVGRGLAVLKAACGHGNFMARLDVLGIDDGVARKFVRAASKFSNRSSTTDLTKAIGSQTKLFEMLILDDEQLEELELTGKTGELHLDKIATMSVKELRSALREAKADAAATDRVLEQKSSTITQLQRAVEAVKQRVAKETPDEAGAQLREEVSLFAFEAEATILGKLTPGFEALAAHAAVNDCTHEDFMAGCLCQIESALLSLRGRFNVKAAPDGDERPLWTRPEVDTDAIVAAKLAELRANRQPGAAHV